MGRAPRRARDRAAGAQRTASSSRRPRRHGSSPTSTHNLDATREAFSLEQRRAERAAWSATACRRGSPPTDDALDRVPLFDTDATAPAPLQVLQGRTATRITDVDLDRYEVDGELRPVMVAAAIVEPRRPARVGMGADSTSCTPTATVSSRCPPIVPTPTAGPTSMRSHRRWCPDRTELYFGEGVDGWYAIVGTKRDEQGGAEFDADTGIEISSVFRRGVLTLATGDVEPLLSAELTSDSQLLYRRGVVERLSALAPFLTFGGDPYPVVTERRRGVGRRRLHDVDARTRTRSTSGSAGDTVNYVHASVKATVDAYDGTVHVYRTEVGGADDPILDAWEEIFPGLIEPIATMPAELQAHLLYPPELLAIQTQLLGRYHVDRRRGALQRHRAVVAVGGGVDRGRRRFARLGDAGATLRARRRARRRRALGRR